MTTCIFQFLIGPPNGQEYCIESISRYCQRHGIRHHLSQSPVIRGNHIMFEKIQLFSLFKAGFDRVLYLDADVMATPQAENIFNAYPDTNKFYAYDENDHTSWMDRDGYVFENSSGLEWPKNAKGKKQYFNAGIMLLSKDCMDKYPNAFNLSDIPDWPNIWYFGDQTIDNYWVVKNKIPFKTIDYSFNRMDLGNFDNDNERYKANFIHYAGPCKYGDGNKPQTMKNDYNNLYG